MVTTTSTSAPVRSRRTTYPNIRAPEVTTWSQIVTPHEREHQPRHRIQRARRTRYRSAPTEGRCPPSRCTVRARCTRGRCAEPRSLPPSRTGPEEDWPEQDWPEEDRPAGAAVGKDVE